MRFQFIGAACGIFEGSAGTRILCDPWIVDGVFEGSWYHYPPLTTTIDDLQNVDAIYVSHIHPDHYDERYFNFRKDIPIIVLDDGANYLIKNLTRSGYSNLINIKDGEGVKFHEFTINLFAPFVSNNFFEAVVGYLIDSAMIIECENTTAFNANDNSPDVQTCKMLVERFGNIDLAMLPYGGASSYPSCFSNLSEPEKFDAHNRILNRKFAYMRDLVEALDSKFVLPFAGSYVLGGKNYYKNQYLGATTVDKCAEYLRANLRNQTSVVCLREKDTFNLSTGISDNEYVHLDEKHMESYINDELRDIIYDYENDPDPDLLKLESDIYTARERMASRASKFNISFDMNVSIIVGDKKIKIVNVDEAGINLDCELDVRLLRRILDRKAFFNNADIGCHITFWREPDIYRPDMFTALNFFHL
jgi:UDP-MurNAc hydroxylase